MISVVIPAYNSENTIERCLDSILNQTINDFEVIVVDDGSTDRTKNIIECYVKRNQGKITLVRTENFGVSHARNLGIKKAKGKWITFIDADDYVRSSYLELLLKSSSDYVAMGFIEEDEFGNYVKSIQLSNIQKSINNEEQLIEFHDLPASVLVWGKRFNREIIIKNNIYFQEDLRFREDIVFIQKYSKYLSEFQIIEETAYIHVLYSGQTLSKEGIQAEFCERSRWRKYSLEIFHDEPRLKDRIINQHLYYLETEIVNICHSSNSLKQKYSCIKTILEEDYTDKIVKDYINYFPKLSRPAYRFNLYSLLILIYSKNNVLFSEG